jgi:hypothetical protein
MSFSFSSTGEGARAGAGPGVRIGTEIFNISEQHHANPRQSRKEKVAGWGRQPQEPQGARSPTLPPEQRLPKGKTPVEASTIDRRLRILHSVRVHRETRETARRCLPLMMILLLLFLQKQSLAFAVYLFGIGTLHTGPEVHTFSGRWLLPSRRGLCSIGATQFCDSEVLPGHLAACIGLPASMRVGSLSRPPAKPSMCNGACVLVPRQSHALLVFSAAAHHKGCSSSDCTPVPVLCSTIVDSTSSSSLVC